MDTLPESGEVFVHYSYKPYKGEKETLTEEWDVIGLCHWIKTAHYIFYAWSYTATTAPDEQTTNTPTP